MKLNKKPAYELPEYENEDQYDMQERKAIDVDELNKRSELYDEESLSPMQKGIQAAREEALAKRAADALARGAAQGAFQNAPKKQEDKPSVPDLSDDGDFIYDPKLSKNANLYLKSFAPVPGETLKNEDGVLVEGQDATDYYRDLMDHQREKIQNNEMSEGEIKKFLLVRNMLNENLNKKSGGKVE